MPPIKGMHFFDGRFPIEKVRRRLRKISLSSKHRLRDSRDRAFCRHASSYDPGSADLDWYARLFEPKAELLTGDITPGYARLEAHVIENLFAALPDVKVVLSVRDPVARLWSHVCHSWRKRRHRVSDAKDPGFVSSFLDQEYIRRCSYPSRIFQTWSSILPPEQLLVIQFDHLQADPAGVLQRLLAFLDADEEDSK